MKATFHARFAAVVALALTMGLASWAKGEDLPREVAAKVDQLLAEEVLRDLPAGMTLARRTADEAFLRRIYLDLVGQSPLPGEVTAFVLDPAKDKRAKIVTTLLADPRYGANWARYWRDIILYRRSAEQALFLTGQLEPFLTEQFNRNVSWSKIVEAFVSAQGSTSEHGETALIAAQFAQTVDVAAETSRIFLGIQIQCAQCHDHPTDRWKRQQFHEFAAFFPRVGLQRSQTGGQPGVTIMGADNGPLTRGQGGFPQGAREHFMPDLKDPSSQGTMVAPVFFLTGQKIETGTRDADRRGALAEWLTAKENSWFAKAVVNRLWAELVGEGFYEPVDDLGPDRTASAPKTLDYLAGEFAAHGYDLKWLFESITSTDAYQRESQPRRNPDQPPFTANVPQRLRADQLLDVLSVALGFDMAGGQPAGAGRFQFGFRQQFDQLFGYDPSVRRDQVTSSIPQALMMMNGPVVNRRLDARQSATVLGRLLSGKLSDEEIAVEVYLRCLAREPNDVELKVCLDHVRALGNRVDAFEDIFWSLLNSEEIRYRN